VADNLVDSSVWIPSIRRRANPRIAGHLREAAARGTLWIGGMIELEVLAGANSQTEFDQMRSRLDAARRLDTAESDWLEAAVIGTRMRRIGLTVGSPDLLIATLAIREKLTLLHADADFDRMAEHCDLTVESLVHLT